MIVNCTLSGGNVNFCPYRDEIALMFVSDLMFMTPEGVFLARPASTDRVGEERRVARRLTELGVPILKGKLHATY